jgi:hypothetical protein
VVLMVAPFMMMPKVLTEVVFVGAPAESSRLRMTLFEAPLLAATDASQMAAVEPAVLVFETVRFRPVPPMRPSIVTLSAPFSLMIAPTMLPVTVRAPPVGRTRTDV